MPAQKLTQPFVKSLLPTAKAFIVFDSELKGFGIRVMPSGHKSWVVEYRPNGGGRGVSKRRLSIGSFDEATPASKAREIAKDTLAKVRTGSDPAGERSTNRKAETVAQLLSAFMTDHIKLRRKTNTVAAYENLIALYVLPAIGKKKAMHVTHADIARLVSQTATKKRTSTPGQIIGGKAIANKVVAVLSSAYSWAADNGIVTSDFNPCQKIEKFKEQGRERYLSNEELERLSATLIEAETTGLPFEVDETSPTAKHARKPENRRTIVPGHVTGCIRLLILTGCRLREILHLEWSNVDLERQLLLLPDSKTGRKVVVLSPEATALLRSLPRVGRYVVASTSAGQPDELPRADIKKPWAAITRHAELKGLRIHDLRHSFASFAAARGVSLQAIGALLGHASIQSTARYAHLASDPLRTAAALVGSQLGQSLQNTK